MSKHVTSFNNLMVAVTFAEAGEFDTAHRLLTGTKQILLVCREGHVQDKALHYALNVCKRIDAGLDIFYVSDTRKKEKALQRLLGKLKQKNVSYRLVYASGSWYDALVRYIKTQAAIACAIISETDHLEMTGKWPLYGCPLVVVNR